MEKSKINLDQYKDFDSDIYEYIKQVNNIKQISKEETDILIKRARQNDENALKKLIETHAYVAINVAYINYDGTISFEELLSCCNFFMAKRIKDYVVNNDTCNFITRIHSYINGNIKSYINMLNRNTNDIFLKNNDSYNMEDEIINNINSEKFIPYIINIVENTNIGYDKILTFYIRYGFIDNQIHTYEDIANIFNITPEAVRQRIETVHDMLKKPSNKKKLLNYYYGTTYKSIFKENKIEYDAEKMNNLRIYLSTLYLNDSIVIYLLLGHNKHNINEICDLLNIDCREISEIAVNSYIDALNFQNDPEYIYKKLQHKKK